MIQWDSVANVWRIANDIENKNKKGSQLKTTAIDYALIWQHFIDLTKRNVLSPNTALLLLAFTTHSFMLALLPSPFDNKKHNRIVGENHTKAAKKIQAGNMTQTDRQQYWTVLNCYCHLVALYMCRLSMKMAGGRFQRQYAKLLLSLTLSLCNF